MQDNIFYPYLIRLSEKIPVKQKYLVFNDKWGDTIRFPLLPGDIKAINQAISLGADQFAHMIFSRKGNLHVFAVSAGGVGGMETVYNLPKKDQLLAVKAILNDFD